MSIDIKKEINEAEARLPVNLGDTAMPLPFTIRSIALTVAARFAGDSTVKEGALYNALKMDNKLCEPLNVNHVINYALAFERYLWGEWSKDIAGQALDTTLQEVDRVLKKEIDERTSSAGGANANG